MMGLDESGRHAVTVRSSPPGAQHPECGSHSGESPEIKLATNSRGGARHGAGRKPKAKPPTVSIGSGGPRWFIAEVHARTEGVVAADFEAQGFSALVPRYRTEEGQLRAAFVGFVLVELDLARDAWQSLLATRSVRRLMGAHPERPSALPAAEAAWVISQFGPGGMQRSRALPPEPVAPGTEVRFQAGPFSGRSGSVSWSNGRTAVVIVEGRRVEVAQAALAWGEARHGGQAGV